MSEQHKRILIVDDDPDLLGCLEDALVGDGYRTKTACSADEALQKIKTFQPHLVLTDNEMPGLTGLEMLRDLRRQDNYVTVVFLSGSTDTDCVVQALKAGAESIANVC